MSQKKTSAPDEDASRVRNDGLLLRPTRQNATPANAANTIDATETWLGVTPMRASPRATAEGQALPRVFSWRRLAGSIWREGKPAQLYGVEERPRRPSVPEVVMSRSLIHRGVL